MRSVAHFCNGFNVLLVLLSAPSSIHHRSRRLNEWCDSYATLSTYRSTVGSVFFFHRTAVSWRQFVSVADISWQVGSSRAKAQRTAVWVPGSVHSSHFDSLVLTRCQLQVYLKTSLFLSLSLTFLKCSVRLVLTLSSLSVLLWDIRK